jgi:uncharacterized protein (DUF58 family)
MGLRLNALILLWLTALIAIVGDWSGAAEFHTWHLWCAPAGLLLVGLAYEAWNVNRAAFTFEFDAPPRWYLGRPMALAIRVRHRLPRVLDVELAPAAAPEVSMDRSVQRLQVRANATAAIALSAVARRLGRYRWPAMRTRVSGVLRLAWWPRSVATGQEFQVVPDVVHESDAARGMQLRGRHSARRAASGSEVLQLREYQPGDPQRSIDWKASARARRLISRDFAENQQLDIVIAVDAGRASGIAAGDTDRLALYANVAARLAQRAVSYEDRVGLLIYAERPLAAVPPGQGAAAVMRVRSLLQGMSVATLDSNHALAAIRIRSLVRHRSLIVMLTDLDDASLAGEMRNAVRLLLPTHLPLIAGVASERIAAIGRQRTADESLAWQALAAQEYVNATSRQVASLRALGVSAVLAPSQDLDRAVIDAYLRFRSRRRV